MQEKLTKGIFFGLIGNILFVVFGLICLLYYYTYNAESIFSKIIETLAYCTEFLGFGLLIYADYLLISSLRFRRMLKVSFSAYIILEAVMMFLELNAYNFSFYEPYSLPLAIVHAVVSAMACFAFLQLDAENTKYEVAVIVCITLILAGMLGNILGIRVYFSIIASALGFSVLFGAIHYLRGREEIEIDCYGDRATVAEFNSSTLFADPEEKDDSE
ncbi:MAG: hypothetical protein NC340_01600 [Ruminococcus flavefaciens]|nr:hypothetical protein [Ruminococcus flavefaciens]MCM1228841.1 hypothetical protein [Ruminococcus flavefaciens]